MQSKKLEIWVGLFLLIVLFAAAFISLKVADFSALKKGNYYELQAKFDNIGGLKAQAPIKIGGVVIGRVKEIRLDELYTPIVTLEIDTQYNRIPDNSSLSIRTSGLLGEQYLSLNVGFEDEEMGTRILKNGDRLEDTKSAMVLEDLIGQFLFSNTGKDSKITKEEQNQEQP